MMLINLAFGLAFFYYVGSYFIKELARVPFFWFVLFAVAFAVYLEHQREKNQS
ncbi:hypothetical protein [Cloacibacillus evryensis]|uniref:hypothetical protein n=1 Tax=Cloacibacillus evryensis TaxID=508460 RepID=UPI002108BE99|nr:hypothetical protein [Cloacibacillus evryensis]MCQ4763225.1 hypothetical protein [Cloacibacillus evryensis]